MESHFVLLSLANRITQLTFLLGRSCFTCSCRRLENRGNWLDNITNSGVCLITLLSLPILHKLPVFIINTFLVFTEIETEVFSLFILTFSLFNCGHLAMGWVLLEFIFLRGGLAHCEEACQQGLAHRCGRRGLTVSAKLSNN